MKIDDLPNEYNRGEVTRKKIHSKGESRRNKQADRVELSNEGKTKSSSLKKAEVNRHEAPDSTKGVETQPESNSECAEADKVTNLRRTYDEIPDIRKEKVEEARLKVSTGRYPDKSVLKQVVDKMLDQFGIFG